MTYIKHNRQWKRTTGVSIGSIREIETFMVPDNPSVIQGVTRSCSGGRTRINNEASNASSGPKFFNFGIPAVSGEGDYWGQLILDFTEYQPTKVALGAWYKIGSPNGGQIRIRHMNSDGSVAQDFFASYTAIPNKQQYKNLVIDNPKIVYVELLPHQSGTVSCDITHITVMK